MIEQRRVRFASIDGIERADLPIAAEIWVDDIGRQSWATREVLKLAVLLKRYMSSPDPRDLLLRSIEMRTQVDRKQVQEALRQMQMFGVIEAFNIEGDVVRVSLALTVLQRLQTREVRHRFRELGHTLGLDGSGSRLREDSRWILEPPQGTEATADTDETPAAAAEEPAENPLRMALRRAAAART
jgi:hypothetical protein